MRAKGSPGEVVHVGRCGPESEVTVDGIGFRLASVILM